MHGVNAWSQLGTRPAAGFNQANTRLADELAANLQNNETGLLSKEITVSM